MATFKPAISPRSLTSPHNLLPPIIANERDRQFLINLNQYIDIELGKAKDRYNPEQRYTVYKSAFNQIIDYVTAYKPLLTAVKAEYEECIDTIQRGQKEAFFLSGKLKAMASEPSTIRNYRKRCDELEQRMSVIKDDNHRLQSELQRVRDSRTEKERRAKEIAEPPVREIKRDRRHIPGLTVEQSTDLKNLQQELYKLERQYKELNISYRTRFQKKDTQMQLKEQLGKKVYHRDHLIDLTELQKLRRMKLKTAVEAAQAYLKIQPPHQTIGDAVVTALTRQSNLVANEKGEDGIPRGTPSTTFEEDDPTREKEAEMMLEYIEKFNELLEDNRFEEAAIHAANSPKGILRTPETLNRFKDLKDVHTSSGRSPLLAFCDALMSTVLAYGVQPSEFLSMESVKVALEENKMDLLSHWIAQDRLSVSENLGTMLYNYAHEKPRTARKCLALAQKIYMDAEAHIPAMICMIKQGRVSQALEHGQKSRCHPKDYITVLQTVASNLQLAKACYEHKFSNGKSLLPLGVIVKTLFNTDAYGNGIRMLQDIQQQSKREDGNQTPLRQAIFEDTLSSADDWNNIVEFCQDMGYNELAIDILAAVTLKDIMKNASDNTSDVIKSAREQGIEPPKYDSIQDDSESLTLEVPRLVKARVVGFDDGVVEGSSSTRTLDMLSSRSAQTQETPSSRSLGTGEDSELQALESTDGHKEQ